MGRGGGQQQQQLASPGERHINYKRLKVSRNNYGISSLFCQLTDWRQLRAVCATATAPSLYQAPSANTCQVAAVTLIAETQKNLQRANTEREREQKNNAKKTKTKNRKTKNKQVG